MGDVTGTPPGVPRANSAKIKNAAAAMATTLKAIATGLDLTADELAVAAFLAFGARAVDASLEVRSWLASACSAIDAEITQGGTGQ